jgi:2-iminobutanoate/2-iminopropanoate deaminase
MKDPVHALSLVLGLFLSSSCAAVLERHPKVRHIQSQGRSDDLPFSDVVLAGDTLYVAGTLGIDPRTGEPPEDPEAEIRLMLNGFRDKLALVGMSMDDLVYVQVFASDLSLYSTFNGIYRSYFQRSGLPARAFIGTPPLLRGARFEMTGIAVQQAGR